MADEPTELDRAAYKTALRATNGHKLQIGRASIALEGAVAVNLVGGYTGVMFGGHAVNGLKVPK